MDLPTTMGTHTQVREMGKVMVGDSDSKGEIMLLYVTTQIFLQHTVDIRSDSRCPTPCEGCNTLHYQTPCAQLGRVSQCFPFVTSQIFLWYPADVRSDSGHPTLRNGHGVFALLDNSCPTRPSGPMFSLFVMIQIFLWYTVDIWSDSGCPNLRNGRGIFVLSDNSCPTRLSVPMFLLSNISPFLLPDLFSSLPCLSN